MRFVSIATRSPGFSIAGPEVIRIFTPISFAMTAANVVLPRPGGPCRSTWSSGSFRILAAWIKILRFSFAFSCPMYSAMVRGRRDPSLLSSGRLTAVVISSLISSEKLIPIRFSLYLTMRRRTVLMICSVLMPPTSVVLSTCAISLEL